MTNTEEILIKLQALRHVSGDRPLAQQLIDKTCDLINAQRNELARCRVKNAAMKRQMTRLGICTDSSDER